MLSPKPDSTGVKGEFGTPRLQEVLSFRKSTLTTFSEPEGQVAERPLQLDGDFALRAESSYDQRKSQCDEETWQRREHS
jgi:hypothetical protein